MINYCILIVSIILLLLFYYTKPYYYTKSKIWTSILITIFGIIGGFVGFFGCQTIIYMFGGRTFF